MSPLAFLGLAAAITLLGSFCLALGGRKKTPWHASIDAFRSKLDALKPEDDETVQLIASDQVEISRRHSSGT